MLRLLTGRSALPALALLLAGCSAPTEPPARVVRGGYLLTSSPAPVAILEPRRRAWGDSLVLLPPRSGAESDGSTASVTHRW
jgi:hypothetical protein